MGLGKEVGLKTGFECGKRGSLKYECTLYMLFYTNCLQGNVFKLKNTLFSSEMSLTASVTPSKPAVKTRKLQKTRRR